MNRFKRNLFTILFLFPFSSFAQTLQKPELPDSVVISSSNVPFRKTPENTGYIISRVNNNKKAILLDLENDHLKIRIDSVEGYVSYIFVSLEGTSLKDYFEQYVINERNEIKAKKDSIRSARYMQEGKILMEEFEARQEEMVRKYGAVNGKKIANREIWIGMTEEMLYSSWGYPNKINRTVTGIVH